MSIRMTLSATGLSGILLLAGCHGPSGAFMPYTGGSQTYTSTEMQPKNVRILDNRSGEVLFDIEIPVGKQLTLDFLSDRGDDPVYSPDLMRWQLFDIGTRIGSLRNSMSVPAGNSRKIQVDLRPGPEYVIADPRESLRVDDADDRPDWWSPRGGTRPDVSGRRRYDH